jgi:SUF system FeS cluster assembly, SufBD
MGLESGRLEAITIVDFAILQFLEVKQGQTQIIHFQSSHDITQPINLQITQSSNSIFKLICVFNHSVDLNLNFIISGNNTDSQIFNLVDLDSDKTVILNQKIATSFTDNQVQHITKCVLDQNSSAAIKHIAKANSKTKNLKLNQKIQSLILSTKARVEMQPILQIESEDVQCKHGSNQGFLDTNAIFYLQSRGLNLENAKQLLVEVFKGEILG